MDHVLEQMDRVGRRGLPREVLCSSQSLAAEPLSEFIVFEETHQHRRHLLIIFGVEKKSCRAQYLGKRPTPAGRHR